MKRSIMLVVVLLAGCGGPNPCERAHEHVAECLGVTYTADETDKCTSPATPSNVVCSTGTCDGLSACEAECFLDTDCKWIDLAARGGDAHGLFSCLDRCAAAN